MRLVFPAATLFAFFVHWALQGLVCPAFAWLFVFLFLRLIHLVPPVELVAFLFLLCLPRPLWLLPLVPRLLAPTALLLLAGLGLSFFFLFFLGEPFVSGSRSFWLRVPWARRGKAVDTTGGMHKRNTSVRT